MFDALVISKHRNFLPFVEPHLQSKLLFTTHLEISDTRCPPPLNKELAHSIIEKVIASDSSQPSQQVLDCDDATSNWDSR